MDQTIYPFQNYIVSKDKPFQLEFRQLKEYFNFRRKFKKDRNDKSKHNQIIPNEYYLIDKNWLNKWKELVKYNEFSAFNINRDANDNDYNIFKTNLPRNINELKLSPLDNSNIYNDKGVINPLAEFIIIDKKCQQVFAKTRQNIQYNSLEVPVPLTFTKDFIVLHINNNTKLFCFRDDHTKKDMEIIIQFKWEVDLGKIFVEMEQAGGIKFWLKDKSFNIEGPDELDIHGMKLINKNLKLKLGLIKNKVSIDNTAKCFQIPNDLKAQLQTKATEIYSETGLLKLSNMKFKNNICYKNNTKKPNTHIENRNNNNFINNNNVTPQFNPINKTPFGNNSNNNQFNNNQFNNNQFNNNQFNNINFNQNNISPQKFNVQNNVNQNNFAHNNLPQNNFNDQNNFNNPINQNNFINEKNFNNISNQNNFNNFNNQNNFNNFNNQNNFNNRNNFNNQNNLAQNNFNNNNFNSMPNSMNNINKNRFQQNNQNLFPMNMQMPMQQMESMNNMNQNNNMQMQQMGNINNMNPNNMQIFQFNQNMNLGNNFAQSMPNLNLVNNNSSPNLQQNMNLNNKLSQNQSGNPLIAGITYPHPAGLLNVGQSCYMNATIECLSNIRNLSNYLLLNYGQFDIDKQPMCVSYSSLLYDLLHTKEAYIKPILFKQIIGKMNPLFEGNHAADAKDLILFIIETLHNELKNPSIQNDKEIDFAQQEINARNEQKMLNDFLEEFKLNQTIISKSFYGTNRSIMKCNNCGLTKYSFQTFNLLIFPLKKVKEYKQKNRHFWNKLDLNLYDAFLCEQERETLDGENMIYCNNCRQLAPGFHEQDFYTLPPLLIIILNRGRNNQDFNEEFRFDEILDFTDKNIVKSNDSNKKYYLCGIITHLGESGSGGHFIAYCRNSQSDCFYCYNDNSVSPCSVFDAMSTKISDKDAEKKTPYILLYHYMK